MEAPLSYQQAITRASLICSKSEKCKSEMISTFEKWGLSEEDIEKGIEFLEKERYLDEERFAHHFVHDKFYLNKWGKYKISYMLRSKGIPEDLITSSLESISSEEYENSIRKQMIGKTKSIKAVSILEKKSKLIHFALGRGFESELVYRIADEILSDEELHS
jgi:regulatory protein